MKPKTLLGIWWLTDILLFVFAYLLAYFLRVGVVNSSVFTIDKYILVTFVTAIIWLFMVMFLRCFGLSRVQTSLKSLFYLAASFAMAVMVHALMYYFLYQEIFSRLLLIYAFVFSALFVTVWHIVFQRWRHYLLYKQKTYPTLLVGVTRESKYIVKQLQQHQFPLHIVGIVDSSGVKDKEIEGVPVLGKLNVFKKLLDEQGITHVIQASDLEHVTTIMLECQKRELTFMLLPSVLGLLNGTGRTDYLLKNPVISVAPWQKEMWWFR